MAISLASLVGQRRSPLTAIAGVLAVVGLYGVLQSRPPHGAQEAFCHSSESLACEPEGTVSSVPEQGVEVAPARVLSADEACRNVGYLCVELARTDRIRIQRWKDFTGPMVVYVPRPDFEEPGVATRLQQAAVIGLRAWNGQPHQILTDVRGDHSPLFSVQWTRSLGGNRIGVAHTRWSPETGLTVVSIELATRSPFAPDRVVDPEQVRLTAAHEMGHALGLPHSESPRDVMYPMNTATSLTAQDYRTMESLYRMKDGTEIVR